MDSTVISRRAALAGLAVAATAKGLTSSALAQRRILGGEEGATVSEANLRPRPIAVPPFISDDPKLGVDLAAIVANDLESSGLFIPLDQRSFIQRFESANETPRSADWRSIGAEALVVGQVRRGPDGRLEAEFRVWDTVLGKQLAGQRFRTIAQNWRRVGHIIADQAWEKLTLERGYFDTRIAFIDETGPKDKRIKRLAIMDQDGENVRLLSRGEDLVLTPRFSPVSQEIVYMAYAKTGRAESGRVVVFNIESGQREVVGDVPGTTYAPRFSPDGQRIVMSQSQGGASSLVELDLRSRSARRLTELTGQIVDTGACYAPDGAQLVFESDRSGNQQLYVMGADGAAPRRISNGDGRYSTPVWSPRGDYVAFTKQASGRFLIGVMKPDGSGERILTDGFHNEGPTWAPNGRFLMFFRESQGANGGPRLHSVDLTGRNERVVRTPSFASDPAWSPLLK